jgi:hypothetical protein
VSSLGGQTVQAQTPNSPKFVKLLLNKEAKAIKSDTKALNMRDKDIAKFEATKNPKLEKQLEKSLTKLHNQILGMTTKLQAESVQVYTGARILSPPNPSLKSSAFANLLMVQLLSVRAGLGVVPATPTQ